MRFVGSVGALPVPVGPEPQAPRPIAYAAKNTDLLLADAAERSRAAEWPWDMWCRICHIRPTSHRTEAEALEAADRHVHLRHAPQAEVHRLMTAGGLAELERLTARVAELEADLALANGVLEDVARARLDTCPCAADRPHQVGCPQDGVPVASPSFAERAAGETDPARRTAWRMLAQDVTDGEHYGLVHHDWRIGRDLPETGGTQ